MGAAQSSRNMKGRYLYEAARTNSSMAFPSDLSAIQVRDARTLSWSFMISSILMKVEKLATLTAGLSSSAKGERGAR